MEARATIDRPRPANLYNAPSSRWRLFCSHGTILFYIVRHPGCTTREISDALALTPRTVWGLIGDLRHAKLITVRREGKRHQYCVDPQGRFPDPILSHLTLGEAMRAIEGKVTPITRGPEATSQRMLEPPPLRDMPHERLSARAPH